MLFLALHNIRSAENVGSMFRTSDACGVAEIFLCGYTPAPVDQFGRPNSKIAKTALGAECSVKWHQTDIFELIKELKTRLKKDKKQGLCVIALEQHEHSIDYRKVATSQAVSGVENTLLIVGNEVEGIPEDVLNVCDVIMEIPMRGEKESLNVSVAAGIALFALQQ